MAERKPRKKRESAAKKPEAAAPAKPVTPPVAKAPAPANENTTGDLFNAASAQELLAKGIKKAKEFAEENPNAAGAAAGVVGAAFISTALPVLAAGALLGT